MHLPSAARTAVVFTVLALGWAAQGAEVARADQLAGCWEGRWKSCTSGHEGKLKAVITSCGNGRYKAQFSGTFFKILPFKYEVILTAMPNEDGSITLFQGSSYLGRMFGTFRYNGWADGCHFFSHYCSKDDKGYFKMHRVSCCCC